MQIIKIQFCSWDKEYDFSNDNNLDLKVGDQVIVETDAGVDIGKISEIIEQKTEENKNELKPITRLANKNDIAKLPAEEVKADMIKYCRSLVKKHNLPMKVVDVHCGFDGSRLKFGFIADGRVDFRELVKDLTRHFQKSIILYQLGIRDEAQMTGDIGRCGTRPLCCSKFLKNLGGVTSDMADTQQIAHRGSERLSGSCGRLMCCLKYEQEGYAELEKKLPQIGSIVKYERLDAKVIGWHTLKKTVDLIVKSKDGDEKVYDVSIDNIKK